MSDLASLAVLTLLLPAGAFVLLSVAFPLRRSGRPAAYVSILFSAAALWGAFSSYRLSSPERYTLELWEWLPTEAGVLASVGVLADSDSTLMLILVAGVSFLVQVYSLGYLADEPPASLGRYYAYQSLFAFSMMGLVLAPNFVQLYICWELVGLCSYLLIGYWYQRPEAARAAVKAFWTTKAGDVGLLIGIVLLWRQAGTFDFMRLLQLADTHKLPLAGLGVITFCTYLGAVGKSAQFPLHVWLPDAMEGPTPVSALIHAATMVAAGVFLVGRTYPIFVASGARPVVAFIGAFTALLAALIAVGQFDIKRILAYSTISQLGFMVAALGIGGWVAGLFHLLMHGFFEALLFLGSGSVIHGLEATVGHDSNVSQDIRNMGNMRKFMPTTWLTYMAGYLALAGLVPFAGFWSKDEILANAFKSNLIVWIVLSLASFLTAFYMTRQVWVVFFGNFRCHNPRIATHPSEPTAVEHAHEQGHDEHAGEHEHGTHDPHESPWTMTLPLIILAIFATLAGFVSLGGALSQFFFPGQEAESFNYLTAGIATIVALVGVGLGWALYRNAFATATDADPLERMMPGVFRALNRRLYFDELYANTFGKLSYALALAWNWLDRRVLDRVINGAGLLTMFFGRVNFILDDTLLNDGADLLSEGTNAAGDNARRI